jgi:hypothetical protein
MTNKTRGLLLGMAGALVLVACGGEGDSVAMSPEEAERLAADMRAEDRADEATNAEDDEDAEDGYDAEDDDAEDYDAEDDEAGGRRAEEAGGADKRGLSTVADSRDAVPGILRFEPAVIIDASGFERPMAASTIFIPFGWRAEGGVLWGREYLCTNGYNFNWSAVSGDGLERISVLPQMKWEWNNYGASVTTPGCQIAPYTDIQQFLQASVSGMQPGASIEGIQRRDDLQRQFASYNQVTPMPMGETRTWVEAAEIRYRFTLQGRNMRGSLTAVAVFSLMRTNPGSGMGVMDVVNAYVFPAYGASAPAERFNPALYEAIRQSIKSNADWERRISGHNVAIGRIALEESRKQAAMIARSNEEVARIRQEAWSAHQESADRRAREFGELMKGVETYTDADAPGGQVELSQNYSHAWRLTDGTYVLSNDAGFDPWQDLKVEGKRLDALR